MKSDEELFNEIYSSLKEANDICDFNVYSFIDYCESTYKMTTKEFHIWFRDREYEGNVDQQIWYQFTQPE